MQVLSKAVQTLGGKPCHDKIKTAYEYLDTLADPTELETVIPWVIPVLGHRILCCTQLPAHVHFC